MLIDARFFLNNVYSAPLFMEHSAAENIDNEVSWSILKEDLDRKIEEVHKQFQAEANPPQAQELLEDYIKYKWTAAAGIMSDKHPQNPGLSDLYGYLDLSQCSKSSNTNL